MKKAIIAISLIMSHTIYNMQQVGLSQASQALAAISPQLTQATRNFMTPPSSSPNLALDQRLILKKFNAERDISTENMMQQKYPQIKYISPIYSSQNSRIDMASGMPSFNPFKKPIIMYSPEIKDIPGFFEGILLHELGHQNRSFIRLLSLYTKYGIKTSFIIGVFFKMIAIQYGFLGYLIAPRLFWSCYMRFFEEPAADDFMIEHADKDILKKLKEGFTIIQETNNPNILQDPYHPTYQSRINKIQRAIDGHPNYNRMVRIAILFTITEEAMRLLYNYSTDENSMKQGLKKLEEIENNFESYCNKLEIPTDGRPIYKYALEIVKSYWLTKLYLIESGRAPADIKEEEILEIITTPTETIVEQEPAIKERWKHAFPEYEYMY